MKDFQKLDFGSLLFFILFRAKYFKWHNFLAMSKDKANATSQTVTAVKDGYEPRTFTLQQLEAMGTDPGGETYDGWKIVEKPTVPDEISEAAKAKAEEEKAEAKIKSDAEKASKKEAERVAKEAKDAEKAAKALEKSGDVDKTATKTTNSDATTGKAESSGKSDDSDTERTGGEGSAHGSEGDGSANWFH